MGQRDSHGHKVFRRKNDDPEIRDPHLSRSRNPGSSFVSIPKSGIVICLDPEIRDRHVNFFLGTFRGQLDMHLRALELTNTMLSMPTHQDPQVDLYSSGPKEPKNGTISKSKIHWGELIFLASTQDQSYLPAPELSNAGLFAL